MTENSPKDEIVLKGSCFTEEPVRHSAGERSK